MYKHSMYLTLALIALLHLSSAASRHPRSIWPWSAPEPITEEPLISEKHAEILRQAGYGEYLDLSSHPLWKIHKYEGIDLKPVQIETEIIKSAEAEGGEHSPPQLPQLDESNPVSSVAPLTESQSQSDAESASLSDESDSGLSGDFSPLSYFLPNFGGLGSSDDEEESEKADALADAIRKEEDSHPGFFAKLWSKIWGSKESHMQSNVVEQTADSNDDDDDDEEEKDSSLMIALPPTRQRYAEISLIKPTARQTQYVIREPVNQASQYAFNSGAVEQQQQQQEQVAVVQPVDKWYPNHQLHHSQAYIQSWNPNAAYNVQVAGPSEYPSEHVATVQAYTAKHFQRKVSENQEEPQVEVASVNSHYRRVGWENESVSPTTTTTTESSDRVPKSKREELEKEMKVEQGEVVAPLTESQVQQVAEDLESKKAKTESEWKRVKESIVKALSYKNFMPKKIGSKLKEIQQLIKDRKAGEESINDLRKLQDDFEKRKAHMGHIYPIISNILPPIPSAPMSQQ